MNRFLYVKLGMIALLLTSQCPQAAAASTAAILQRPRVERCLFATSVRGMSGHLRIKDPSETRFVILTLLADCPTSEARVHAPDFLLTYRRANGKEDRAQCAAIATTPADDPDPGLMALGEYASVVLSKGPQRLALAFAVEKDVDDVELFIVGRAEGLKYGLGTARPYSVYITTNLKGATDMVERVRKQSEDAGLQVTATGNGLAENEQENTILYQDGLELVARELSQRLMLQCGVTARLRPIDVCTCNDILVWLGDKRSLTGNQSRASGRDFSGLRFSATAPSVSAESID
jgi:hypothetical protein